MGLSLLDWVRTTVLFFLPCSPIFFFFFLFEEPGYPSLLYLDGSRCRYMSRALGSAESPRAASFFLTIVLRTFAISDKITSIVQVIISERYHSQEALQDEVELI